MSSLQGVGTVKRCLHFMGLRFHCITEVSSFQGGWYIEGVLLYAEMLSWNRRIPLYTEMFTFHGVGVEGSTINACDKEISPGLASL